nr:copper resistance protein B [Ottowia testudinis]
MTHDHGATHGATPAAPTPSPATPPAAGAHDHGATHRAPPAAAAASPSPQAPDAPVPQAAMDHGDMQGGSPPADARDPDAYANGHERGTGEHVPPGVTKLHLGDEHSFASFKLNRLERVFPRRGGNHTAYEGQLKFGGDFNHAVLKAEGEVAGGKLHESRTELLWGHAIAAYWDSQLGLRHDGGEGPSRTWLAFGVEGTAPYWIHTRVTAYLGQSGRTALRLEAEYDAYLTQKLVLQPKTEWHFYSKNDPEQGIGKGLSSASLGLRLRYEFTPQISPYIGVEWQRSFGRTADFMRDAGGRASQTRWVAGLSFWF